MLGEQRRHLALDRLDDVVGMRAGEVEEDGREAAQAPAAQLQGGDRVVEARRRRIGRDRLDLAAMFGQRAVESRPEMLRGDALEGRQAIRRIPLRRKRLIGGSRLVRPVAAASIDRLLIAMTVQVGGGARIINQLRPGPSFARSLALASRHRPWPRRPAASPQSPQRQERFAGPAIDTACSRRLLRVTPVPVHPPTQPSRPCSTWSSSGAGRPASAPPSSSAAAAGGCWSATPATPATASRMGSTAS